MLRCYSTFGCDDTFDFYILMPTKKEGSRYAQERNRWKKLPALSPIYFKTVNRRDSELVSEPLKLGG